MVAYYSNLPGLYKFTSFGEALVRARNKIGLQQKEVAALIKKKDGEAISANYLNALEHDRRNTSDHLIEQFASIGVQPRYRQK